MTLRQPFRPLRPDFDPFLFAAVGEEVDGIPLSVLSALTCLGLDPWEETNRLSSLSRPEAAEHLARLIAELPGRSWGLNEAREIARGLVGFLPSLPPKPRSRSGLRPRYRMPALVKSSQLWVPFFVVVAAMLVSAFLHGTLPFGLGGL